jgi:hypothetical protein
VIKKISALALILTFFSASFSPVFAAIVTVNPQGQVVWQVLGDETNLAVPAPQQIQVKTVAQATTPSPNSQISLTNTDGKITLNVQNGSNDQNIDVTNIKDNIIELQARPNTNDITISNTAGQFTIQENGVKAQTSFPITVDPAKNELSVTTPSGNRLLSVLPYEAVLGLIRAKTIDNTPNTISINENSKGELQYEIKGTRKINLFNVATITADVSSNVSASNGEVLNVTEPQWLKFFGFLFS